MNDQTQDPGNKISARRRLVRGVFAAPAALTLFSGNVAARSLSNCVTKQLNSAVIPPATSVEGTTFVRVQLQRFQGKNGTTTLTNRYSRWVKGDDIVLKQAAGTVAPKIAPTVSAQNGRWHLFDRGVTNLTSNCSTNFDPQSAYAAQTPGDFYLTTTPSEGGTVNCTGGSVNVTNVGPTPEQWVALRVNSNGDILGVAGIAGQTTTDTSAVYQSCWTSFRVG